MKAHTKDNLESLTPELALQYLEEGNKRFVQNIKLNRNLLQQVNETREGQWPFAIILSCIDSRTSAELIFDQGLGDIFSVRIAGNIVNEDIIGSMEFACKQKKSKLVLVLGHTHCGAVQGAFAGAKMGHLTGLLAKMDEPLSKVKSQIELEVVEVSNDEIVNRVAKENVLHSIQVIIEKSDILRQMFEDGEIDIAGGMYSVESGEVDFFHYETKEESRSELVNIADQRN